MILPSYEDPKYVLILRRNDENGDPRLSPIAYANSRSEGREIVSLIYLSGKNGVRS